MCDGDDWRHQPGSGALIRAFELATDAVRLFAAEPLPVPCHSAGRGVVRAGLEVVVAARVWTGEGTLRQRVAPVRRIRSEDRARRRAPGPAAGAQAFGAWLEPQVIEPTVRVLGAERAGWQCPCASLAGWPDRPVSTADPLEQVSAAVACVLPGFPRSGAPGAPSAGWLVADHGARGTRGVEAGKPAVPGVLAPDPSTKGAGRRPEAGVLLTMVVGPVISGAGTLLVPGGVAPGRGAWR